LGYKLANDRHDTRAIQAYLGHRNIQNTARYTALAPQRFKVFFAIDEERLAPFSANQSEKFTSVQWFDPQRDGESRAAFGRPFSIVTRT
jgi:hypothetical protein